jgi:hypothetical protein
VAAPGSQERLCHGLKILCSNILPKRSLISTKRIGNPNRPDSRLRQPQEPNLCVIGLKTTKRKG